MRRPFEQDLYDALDAGMADTHRDEIYLRVRAWHQSNHSRRKSLPAAVRDDLRARCQPVISSDLQARRLENLRALEGLLDSEISEERIMLAELARERGDDTRALELLEGAIREKFRPPLRFAAFVIRTLAQRGNRDVTLLEDPSSPSQPRRLPG